MACKIPSHELHRVVAMGLVYDLERRFLIVQRSPRLLVFPNKWGSPGGGFSREDYEYLPLTLPDGWKDPLYTALRREIREEAGIEVGPFEYVDHFSHIRPDDIAVLGLRFMAPYVSGQVVLNRDELIDHRWVFVEELKNYDLMGGFAEAILVANRRLVYKVLGGAAS
ncbi:MAG: hypothetical protein UY70_C0012G0005 [Candidatus Kaiserbacteria bacterium GW2011_GWB1_52_6]|uniref:Nudix hydrolase domain-containing protein n=2 Tax=Candidatus Kaiseribacteriota TaxID=1752734 RepID=A0A0G1X8H0_9BACT|nr:MAG: hypothetical protein UY67_C0010G0021 [Candidatus Kaiserbacteria bacterium GW2011_GWA2_52_12]KKW27533.1 MAG: hypothetical protein UY70_C0012G0005 [Candidatus Kaiserbacteria bacterium GW2011_GWB1_52_6]